MELVQQCVEHGARVLVQPAIEISALEDNSQLDAMLGNLDQFDWLVFSSRNGVHFLVDRLLQTGKDIALTIANRTQTFKPCDIRVSRTRVSVGNTTFVLGSIQDNDEGGYEICDDNHDRTAISIAQA